MRRNKDVMRRNKDVIIKGAGRFKKPISGNTEGSIRQWFADLTTNLVELGAESIFTDPSRAPYGSGLLTSLPI